MAGTIVGFNHIGISVSDIDRAMVLFRDVLGAEVTTPYPNDDPKIGKVVGLQGARNIVCQATLGGNRFELLQYVEPAGQIAQNHRPCDPGHMHLALTVEDIDGVVDRMRAAGFEPASPVQHGLGGSGLAACYCFGFDGLVIELIEYAPGSSG